MIEAVINGARDDATATPPSFDKATLDNKVEAGLDWAQETSATIGFTYDADAAAAAVAALSGVTDDVATVAAAKAATDVFVSGSEKVGSTFTLTTDTDTFIGGSANDTFQGLNANLTPFDKLDGFGGSDTLNLIVAGPPNFAPGISIENIETINLARTGGGSVVDASVFGNATQIWQIDNAGDINNLVEGQIAGFRDTNINFDEVTYGAGVTVASVALDNVDTNSTLLVNGADVETLNVSGTVDDTTAATITIDLGDLLPVDGVDAITDLNVSFDNDTTLTVIGNNAFTLETIDASGSTGGITATIPSAFPDAYALESIIGGSGADDLTIADLDDFSADTLEVSGGAGNDVFTIGDTSQTGTAVAVTFTGGDGNDTLNFNPLAPINPLANVVDPSEANFMDSLITFADFNVDEDVIDINGFLTGLSNVELANIAAADDLFAAVGLASTAAGTNNIVAFDFGDNAYIYENDNTLGFTSGDGLVQVTGVSSNDFDFSNVI